VLDQCIWVIQHLPARKTLQRADAQLGLLAAQGSPANAADPLPKTTGRGQNIPTIRHVGADEIAHRGDPCRLAPVAAPDNPAKFRRKPARLAATRPTRDHRSPNTQDVANFVALSQSFQPVIVGNRVIVEEGDHVAAGCLYAAVARAGQSLPVPVRHGRNGGKPGANSLQQDLIVVDDNNDLRLPHRLPLQRGDRFHQITPALQRIGADNDCEIHQNAPSECSRL
jgi:hypothetical protein